MKNNIFLIVFYFFSISFYCQKNSGSVLIDSISKSLSEIKSDTSKVIAYTDISIEYQYLDAEKGILYAKKAFQLSNNINWDEGKSKALTCWGINNYILGKNDLAMNKFNQALQYTKNEKSKSKILKNIGAVYNAMGNYSKSLEYNFKALKISEVLNDKNHIAKICTNIGNVYYYISNNKKAIEYYNKSLDLNYELDLKSNICKNLQNIGTVYSTIYEYRKALDYFSKALKISKEIDDKESILYNHYSLGILFYDIENLEKALPNIIKAKKIAQEIHNDSYLRNTKTAEAKIYFRIVEKGGILKNKNLLIKAEILIQQAVESTKKANDLVNLAENYKLLSKVYSLKQEYKNALESNIIYADIRDSIFTIDSKETVKNLEDQRTIELKNKEIQLNKVKLEAREKQRLLYIGGLILLVIIGSLLFYQSQNRKKNNQKLKILNTELDQANKIKAKFFSILNHDLRSPVYNLIHFLHLQKENPELLTEESKERIEAKTLSSVENLLISMEDMLLWSKGQMENFKPQPKQIYISVLLHDVKNHFVSEDKVQIIFENPQNIQVNTDEDYLKTIIRNLTGNAIKALTNVENPTIIWKATQQNNQYFLSIQDNGKGATIEQFKALYDENEVVGIQSGLGLHLIRDLAKAINCEITVNSSITLGTTITLQFL